jgi:hypothetical protein
MQASSAIAVIRYGGGVYVKRRTQNIQIRGVVEQVRARMRSRKWV